jgi:TatD DNase family protein
MSITFFDTHVHFDGLPGSDLAAALDRAVAAGVTRMLAVGGSPDGNACALTLADRYPARIRAAVGYDRYRAAAADGLEALNEQLGQNGVVALGEIGLDFHHAPETAAAQLALFRRMLALALDRKLPVIVHSREAEAETLAALEAHARAWSGPPERLGVLHCFTGSADFTRRLLAAGYYLSFSGIVTFRNASGLRAIAAGVPLGRLLIETDSPYLAPMPCRGRPNEPALLPHVAAALAAARGVTTEAIAEATTRNAERLFGAWSTDK